MATPITIPEPLVKMFEHLELDIERGLELLPANMADAITNCRVCNAAQTCDYDVESRYFRCPNRELLDNLEYLEGKV